MPFLLPNQQCQSTEGIKNVLAKVDFLEKSSFSLSVGKITVKMIFATENQVSNVFYNVTVAMVLHCQFSWTLNDARNGATTNVNIMSE